MKAKLACSQEGLERQQLTTEEVFEASILSASTKSGDSSYYKFNKFCIPPEVVDSLNESKGQTLSEILESEEHQLTQGEKTVISAV